MVFAILGLLISLAPSSPAHARTPGEVGIYAWELISRNGPIEEMVRTDFEARDGMFWPRTIRPAWHFASHPCVGLIRTREAFSLDLMEKRKVISREQRRILETISAKLDARQMQIYESTMWYSQADAEKRFSELPPDWIAATDQVDGTTWLNIRRATLWSVSGQILNPDYRGGAGRRWVRKKLAIQHEPNSPFAGQTLFGKDTFLWEWGRGGRHWDPGHLERLVQLAVLRAYMELRILGGNLADAWVVVHSAHPATTALYKSLGGEEKWVNPATKEVLLARPLEAFLRDPRYAPRNFFPKLEKTVELSKRGDRAGGLSDSEGLDFLLGVRHDMKMILDLSLPGIPEQGHPLILVDRSTAFLTFAINLLERYGLTPVRDPLTDFLRRVAEGYQDFRDLPQPYYFNPDMIVQGPDEAVYISGIDPGLAAGNPDYVREAITAAYHFYLRKIEAWATLKSVGMPSRMGMDWQMHEQGIEFHVFSEDGEVLRQLQKLGGKVKEVRHIERIHEDAATTMFSRQNLQTMASTTAQVVVFKPLDFMRLTTEIRTRSSPRADEVERGARLGRWQVEHDLRHMLTP